MIDGIVVTDFESRNDTINRLIKIGVEPRKIILWNNRGIIEPLTFQADDGTTVACMEGVQFHIRNQDDANFVGQIRGWLQAQRQFYSLNPAQYREYISLMYRQVMGKNLDWEHLNTYTEKMAWLKLYDSTPLKTRLADKYLVRQWVAEKIGAEYLIPLLGVWNNFDEINFDALPNQFVLKCNHGSGMNIICRNKNKFNYESAREKLTAWLAVDYGTLSFEPHYNDINKKIIAEKFIEDMNGGLNDYKIHCFNGKVNFVQVIGNRDHNAHTGNQNFYDFEWNDLKWTFEDYPHFPFDIKRPHCLEEMKRCAEKLSEDFSYVRIDFYEIKNRVLFGEMTFIPAAGFYPYKKSWTLEKNLEIGNMMTLPDSKYKFWER